MSPSTAAVRPSRRAIEITRVLLRNLSASLQTYRLYPPGHPNRVEATSSVLGEVHELVTAAGPSVLFATRHGFYLGPALLSRESISLHRLMEAFETTGLEAVELRDGVAIEDVDALTRILLGERPLTQELGGLALNRVRPDTESEDREAQHLTALLRAYSVGLDVLRDTADRVVAGEDVDIESTRRVVEQLAAEVAGDPMQALLVTALKSYEEYTYYHMLNVCVLSIALGHAIGLRPDQVATLGVGALLHDVGKIKVPRDVLQHVGALSEEQWRLIQKHPVDGAGLILMTSRELFDPAVSIVLEHHAGYDLSGYPELSDRPRPSMPARLVSVADCFDAVTSKRSYRHAEERRQALSILQAGAGRGLDPIMVRVFVRMLGIFPIGSLVLIDSGEIGMVVRNHERLLARPVIRLVFDSTGTPCDPDEVDLSERDAGGSYRHVARRSLDPEELGVDMLSLVVSGLVEPPIDEGDGGLVHEPAHGEAPPPGYVDTHAHVEHAESEPLAIDEDVSAPFPR